MDVPFRGKTEQTQHEPPQALRKSINGLVNKVNAAWQLDGAFLQDGQSSWSLFIQSFQALQICSQLISGKSSASSVFWGVSQCFTDSG